MAIRDGAENDSQESLRLEDPANDDPETKVRLDDPEENDDGDDAEDGDKPAKPEKLAAGEQPRKKDGKWAEKKAERGRARREEKAWEQERVLLQRRLEDNDRRFKQLTDEFDRFRQTARGSDQRPSDPYAAQLADIETRLEQELALIENDPNRGYKHYNQLRRQEQTLITQQALAQQQALQQAQQRQQPQDPYQHRRPVISMEFPWTDDPRYDELTRKGRAYRDYLIHHEGRPDTIDTDREALTQTVARFGAEFGLRAPAAPSQRTRGLWQAPASRSAPDRRPVPREVDLGEVGRGTGLNAKTLAAVVGEALREEN